MSKVFKANFPVNAIYPLPEKRRAGTRFQTSRGRWQNGENGGMSTEIPTETPLRLRYFAESAELVSNADEYVPEMARKTGITHIPAALVEAEDETLRAELRLLTAQRVTEDIFERAERYRELTEMRSYTQEQLARRLNVSQSNVANRIRLLKMTAEERELIRRGGLSERHARTILRINAARLRVQTIEAAAENKLNVSETERLVDAITEQIKEGKKPGDARHVRYLIRDLGLLYNTIDRAVNMMRDSCTSASVDKIENGRDVRIIIDLKR